MSPREVMAELESLGTPQNREVYARHGYSRNMFGVSFANLQKLRKKIKKDHALAQELWNTGNEDARTLAVLVADPEAMSAAELDAWAADIGQYVLADVFSRELASKSPHARKKAASWIKSTEHFTGQAGWDVVALLAQNDAGLEDEWFEKRLATIEKRIDKAKNRVRHAMNNAPIAIGGRNERLRRIALAAAERIGKVEVDHGETGCKTPDARGYIAKIWKRKTKPASSPAKAALVR